MPRHIIAENLYRSAMGFLWWFSVVALVEMATFFWVSNQIGLGPAILIALGTALVGAYLVRASGAAVWRRIRDRVREQTIPGRELVAGAAVLVAGALLISPGFITDVVGFSLLVPAVQAWLYRVVATRFSSRVQVFRTSGTGSNQDPDTSESDWEVTEIIDVEEAD